MRPCAAVAETAPHWAADKPLSAVTESVPSWAGVRDAISLAVTPALCAVVSEANDGATAASNWETVRLPIVAAVRPESWLADNEAILSACN